MGGQQRLQADARRSIQRVSRHGHPLSGGRRIPGNTRLHLDPPRGRRSRRAAGIRHRWRDNAVVALWADSWHQHPEAKVCEGSVDENGVISVGLEYGDGWRWQIILDATKTDVLVLRMDNVIPPEVATEESQPVRTW